MRHLLALALLLLIFGGLTAQVPQGIGYQGVATDPQGLELTNQSISVRASILSGAVNGEVQWQETHSTSTDDFGLFALTIGEGANTGVGQLASFSDIPWGDDTYFLQIEMDASGGNDYLLMGVNQMMSVPYALHAESAENAPTDFDGIVNYLLQDATFVENFATILAGDSVFVTNLTNLNGGGCDFSWPDGKNGELFTMALGTTETEYTIPDGKNLYITNVKRPQNNTQSQDAGALMINGQAIMQSRFNTWSPEGAGVLDLPIIAGHGDVMSAPFGQTTVLNGFLVDSSVDALTVQLSSSGSPYTVPNGKILVILHVYMRGTTLIVSGPGVVNPGPSGVPLASGNWSHPFVQQFTNLDQFNEGLTLGAPLFIGPNQVISCSSGNDVVGTVINGYLVDEDYFEGCD